jgi:hypothetical protein
MQARLSEDSIRRPVKTRAARFSGKFATIVMHRSLILTPQLPVVLPRR